MLTIVTKFYSFPMKKANNAHKFVFPILIIVDFDGTKYTWSGDLKMVPNSGMQ